MNHHSPLPSHRTPHSGLLPLLLAAIFAMLLATTTAAFAQPPTASSPAPSRTVVPVNDGGNLPVQRLGRDDLIGITVYDAPELSRTVRVAADGTIRLPMLKQRVTAGGLFPSDLETALATALSDEKLMVDPVVTVSVMEYRSRPVSVVGAVKKPLTFQAAGPLTLLDAISRAEGLSEAAGPEILISRREAVGADGKIATLVQRVTVAKLIDAADPAVNVLLEGGEEIRVPEAGRVYVVGNVKKPGTFAIKDGSETSLLKVLAMSEGLLPYAMNQAYIYRQEGGGGPGKNEIPIELRKIIDRKSPDVAILPNDIVYIPDNRARRATLTTLEKSLVVGAGLAGAIVFAVTR